MIVVKGQMVQETYTIRGKKVMVVMDMDENKIYIKTHGFSNDYPTSMYMNFDGDMKTFAERKIYG